jgi:tRNA-specific 2-thiouridylase
MIGQHKGIHLYTPGQRKRLGVATGKPLYVVKIDARSNTVYVGPREAALAGEFIVDEMNWLVDRNALRVARHAFRATVKVRSTMKDEPAAIHVLDYNRVKVVYDEPQWAPAPGQAAVFYDGDVVIGGGVIQ